MLSLKSLTKDLFDAINRFYRPLNKIKFDFFKNKMLHFGSFKPEQRNIIDFSLSFQDKSLIGWLDILDKIGELIIQESSSWSNAKLSRYQIISYYNDQNKSVLAFEFDRKDFLIRIFKDDFKFKFLISISLNRFVSFESSLLNNLDELSLSNSNELGELVIRPMEINRICVILIQSDDEWSNLRNNYFKDFLVNISNTVDSSIVEFKLTLEELNDLISNDSTTNSNLSPNLSDYKFIYLIISKSTEINDTVLKKMINLKIIRTGNVICDLNESTYRSKLKEEFKDRFDDQTIDKFIKMKFLSFKPDRQIKLDLDYKQIIFINYNFSRVYQLIQKCQKIFDTTFELDKTYFLSKDRVAQYTYNLFVDDELIHYSFKDHFINFAKFKLDFKQFDQIELIGSKVFRLLVHLCNDLSKYYQKRKLLIYTPGKDIFAFKVNLLRSVLNLMDLYFILLNIVPIKEKF